MTIQFFLKLGVLDQFYLSYNGAKAAIETLQQSDPKLFARAQQINDFFLILDFGCMGYMGTALLDHLDTYGAFSLFPPHVTVVAILCVGVGLVIFAILCVRYINAYFQTQHAKTDPVEDFRFEGTANHGWERPVNQKVEQGLSVAQIAMSLGLAILSSQPVFFLMVAALQGYRLQKISELKWLYFEHGSHTHLILIQKMTALIGEVCKKCSKDNPTIFCPDGLCHSTCIISQISSMCPNNQ